MLRVITTGGTIDKSYDPRTQTFGFHDSFVPEMLASMCLRPAVEPLMAVDSLEMTDEQRQQIARACLDAPERSIVVTHGTDTMAQTAKVVEAALAAAMTDTKTVVLTGAMVPFSCYRPVSDALDNLRYSCHVAETMAPGVYLGMKRQLFTPDNVRKDYQNLRFTSLG